jgi:5,10-methylene-tetrahydrofolate dehydrogenase/methenyl tetrahydrofolate cyclohydrolase
MTEPHHPLHIPGRAILREVVRAYPPYRDRIAERDTRVLIVRFTPGPAADDEWATRMEASAVSAQQKVRLFTALGAHVESLTLPDRTAPGELIDRVQAANDDPRVAAVIVQSPPPVQLRPVVNLIDPGKDIDALGVNSPRPACATTDGIVRIAEPFLSPDTTVAVVGARGFVGSGVTRLLRGQGHDPLALDDGDDLRQLLDVDVVLSATGRPHLLTAEYLHRGHLLVVDSGFVPYPDGPRGDVAPDAARAPAAITPVPGGIGPVEMAVLAERLILTVEPELPSWR